MLRLAQSPEPSNLKGPGGRLTGSRQYSFIQKFVFAGIGGAPERNENTFLASLRYYPF